ncbi:Holliday junction branch migration protein RuvA [Rhodovulum sulfidophilum]|uniref:Holliday junction branch migration protein RuvA n=1 Tax=Rhodovulum sulfidophilum TaxID=35806 RepID=UPI001921433C|nr:Holliday junction branch migration protein RuvA [Rhodovulum sulfidophilum]MBL3574582.1 Holliday junction branch migration protein RuvA [Rhodovulum sulfidophilum]MCE8432855.1 Holliday junction branch migration protein RuvA [Rhodovulum sulfidophilum]MCF4117332.1 Holliday junction branch migration protein RuvA [Rhodovulum sulfidophilum]
MIGRLAGRLIHKGADQVMIDVGGVGYVVHVSDRTLMGLPGLGEAVALYTDLLVREDLLQLYGFPTLHDREWHRLLMGVQGIGAKASMAILGTLGAEGVGRAIALGDWGAIKAAPGVGPKIAQRVVNELKEKAPAVMALGGHLSPDPAAGEVIVPADPAPKAGNKTRTKAPAAAPVSSSVSAQADALSALGNLGYAPSEAAQAVARAAGETPEADTTALIRAALKLLAPRAD